MTTPDASSSTPSIRAPMSPEARQAFADFVVTLRSDGLREALAKLGMRSDFRFIGIWRFQDGKANTAVHCDREDPSAEAASEVEDTATCCCHVRERGEPFKIPNAMVDERLSQHPACQAVPSYSGVPVLDNAGKVVGTLRHYDLVPRDTRPVDIPLMLNVASYLTLGGHVPPCPEN